jgi:hypothetical protein
LITPSGLMMKVPRSARPSFLDVHAEGARQGVGRVADQRELRLAHGRRGFVPDLVREVGVGGDDVDLGTGLLELGVVLGRVFDFGRAVEGEGRRHEDHDRPLALERGIRDLDELAVVEGGGLERFDGGVDQGHCDFLGWGRQSRHRGLAIGCGRHGRRDP